MAAVVSFARVLLHTGEAIGELVWAEDGLFPLCVRKAGVWDCLVDPFAGYLLGLPRLLAGITAAFPLDSWGWSTNIVAAVSWGAFAALSAYWLTIAGVRLLPSIVVAMIPVSAPLVGLEAVNSIGSVYMPLLFTATLAIAVGWTKRSQTVIAVGLAFLAAVTIPTALILVVVLAVSIGRQRVARRSGLIVFAALMLGGLLQFLVVLSAPSRRNMSFSSEALGAWLNDLPTALLTVWPGLYFGSVTIFGIFTMPTVAWTGVALAVGLVVLGVVLSVQWRMEQSVAGVMIVASLAYSLVPTATGYASNRYFVLTVIGIFAAAVLLLDNAFSTQRRMVFVAVVVFFAVGWSVALPASAWRVTASPPWSAVLDQARSQCANDPMAPARFTFSPDWPQEGVTDVQPPTNQLVPCSAVDLPPDR